MCAAEFLRPETFDVVVADAPYGVQVGRTAAKGLARRPTELLAEAAPVRAGLLRPGCCGRAARWASRGTRSRREAAGGVLAAAGLEVLDGAPYDAFRHRVDQAIQRDILVARKLGRTA